MHHVHALLDADACIMHHELFPYGEAYGQSIKPDVRLTCFAVCQAFGAQQHFLVGTTLQRSLLMCIIVFVAVQGLWTQMSPLLMLAGVLLSLCRSPLIYHKKELVQAYTTPSPKMSHGKNSSFKVPCLNSKWSGAQTSRCNVRSAVPVTLHVQLALPRHFNISRTIPVTQVLSVQVQQVFFTA